MAAQSRTTSTVKKILPSGPTPPQPSMPAMAPPPQVQRAVLRVNRACTSCRKHKMRCEGADDPPCARCKQTGTPCVFESIKKEQSLDSVAVERLSSLESQFKGMQGTMQEILATLRGAPPPLIIPPNPTPNGNGGDPGYFMSSGGSDGPMSAHPYNQSHSPQDMMHHQHSQHSQSMISPVFASPPLGHGHNLSSSPNHPTFSVDSSSPHHQRTFSSSSGAIDVQLGGSGGTPPTYGGVPGSPPMNLAYPGTAPNEGRVTFAPDAMNKPSSPRGLRPNGVGKGKGVNGFVSNVTSAATSDDEGELPPKALVAPIEVLNDLATVAAEKAGVGSVGSPEDSESPNNTNAGAHAHHTGKKRKLNSGSGEKVARYDPSEDGIHQVDVIDSGIISEEEARDLYRIYFTPSGCYRFLAVFNPEIDTFEDLRRRSPFVFCAILMVAARVRDGGNAPSRVHSALFTEASNMARDTLFKEPQGVECVQAMLLLAGWSSKTGWLAAGHAIRMGMELAMHKALPRLAAKVKSGRVDPSTDPRTSTDAHLVHSARTWLGLFVFELQIGRGTGRPAMIRGDKSIKDARMLLRHPLSIGTDARLVSTCELLEKQTHIHDQLDEEVNYEKVVGILRAGTETIDRWHSEWDVIMSHEHPDAVGFFRSSAQIQRMYAILFMHAIALRELRTVQDANDNPHLLEIMLFAVQNAQGCLDICINAPEYREGLRYAVTYTQTSAAFAAAFLLRFARLFPRDVDPELSIRMVENLMRLFSETPAARFVPSLQNMVEYTRLRWNEFKATQGMDGMNGMSHHVPPTPPSQYTNDFQSIINPSAVFDPSMTMFPPVESNSTTMEWAHAVNMLDGFGLPASGMSTNGGSLGWLPNSILGDLAVPPSQMEGEGVREWSMQFAFDI